MPRAKTKISAEGPKGSRVGRDVLSGLKEALAHVRGEITLPSREYEVPGPVDVRAIRARSSLSQSQFAREYGFSVRTLQEWESGGAKPPSAVRAYLTVIDRNPKAVRAALRKQTAA
ncbi:MAG: helix-turn-helix domain-containing protein [Candidatus Solibacter sp.]